MAGETNSVVLIATAQAYAQRMLEGSLTPYDAGLRIWKDCSLCLTCEDHRLDPFVYWASEYEDADDDDRREYCEYALKEAARDLIRNGTAI